MKYVSYHLLRFSGLLVLCLALLPLPAVGKQQGLLWKITPAAGKPSYLFGTIHSEDPRVLKLPAEVKNRFDQAGIFCGEMKMDMGTQIKMSQGMVYLNGQSLARLVDEPLYTKTILLVSQHGIPKYIAPMMKPWAAGLTLSFPVPKTGNFLDLVLYQKAEQQGKTLCGLETPEEIVSMLDNTPMETQKKLLRVAVREHPKLDSMFETMLKHYLARDLTALQKLSDRELESSDADLVALVNNVLITKRNHNMLQNMQPNLKKGNAFIAVGALHLPGDTGLLRLLEQRGYRVKPVY